MAAQGLLRVGSALKPDRIVRVIVPDRRSLHHLNGFRNVIRSPAAPASFLGERFACNNDPSQRTAERASSIRLAGVRCMSGARPEKHGQVVPFNLADIGEGITGANLLSVQRTAASLVHLRAYAPGMLHARIYN